MFRPSDIVSMFSSWSIKRCIVVGFGFMLSCMGFTALISMVSMQKVLSIQDQHARGEVPAARLANDFQREMLNARVSLVYHMTIQRPGAKDLGLQNLKAAESTLDKLVSLVSSQGALSDLNPGVERLHNELKSYEVELRKSLSLVDSGVVSGPAYAEQIRNWAHAGTILVDDADKTRVLSTELSNSRNESNIESLRSTARLTLAAFLLTLLFCVVLATLIIRQINSKLRSITGDLDQSAKEIQYSATELASSSTALSKNSAQQAATIEATSAASTEIDAMAEQTTRNSTITAKLVTETQVGFQKTNESLEEMAVAMETISSSSKKVAKVIKVIDDIAFQTNILALNAAVEAARAGHEGLGFAVVADEVRNLAQRCATAAKDTAALIEESIENSRTGKGKMDRVTEGMHTITLDSSKIETLVEEMKVGGVEQSKGIQQINHSLNHMEQVTQSAAAQAEIGSAAASQLNAQAETMQTIVVRLKGMIGGAEAA